MSNYSHVVNAKEGEQFNTYTTERWPVGTIMELTDGRRYRFGSAGGSNLAVGKLCQSEVPEAAWDELVMPGATVVGDKSITITNGATTITKDELKGGYLNIEDDTGEGHLYKILGNDAELAGSAALVVRIAAPGIVVATTTATTVGVLKNPWRDVIIHPSPPTANLIGVPAVAIATTRYGWFQTRGPASILIDGTVVIGFSVMPSNAVDGAVEAWGLAEAAPPTEIGFACGRVIEVAATTEYGLIDLHLE